MAPLAVGAPKQQTKDEFKRDCDQAQKLGLDGIAFDNWWEDFNPAEDVFNFDYGDSIIKVCSELGMLGAPVFGFHMCGGNVGDTITRKVPQWVWTRVFEKLQALHGVGKYTMDALKFVSEQGNASNEFLSYWVTDLALEFYAKAMRKFQAHFADRVNQFSELNISLGPAGERRMPSYNGHDKGTDYPTRGALQCYSALALNDLRLWAIVRYGTQDAAETAWGRKLDDDKMLPKDVAKFFRRREHIHTQWGRDLMEWYRRVPNEHTRKMLTEACNIFGADDAPFKGVDIGAKVPGVHWRIGQDDNGEIELGDRLAEIAAGLIVPGTDWYEDRDGRGYRDLIKVFKDLKGKPNRVVMHFTCLEMPDGDGKPSVRSMAQSLVNWVGAEAKRQGVPIKGENALAWNLPHRRSWELMRGALTPGGGDYQGLTLLRLSDCLSSEVAREEFAKTLNWVREKRPK